MLRFTEEIFTRSQWVEDLSVQVFGLHGLEKGVGSDTRPGVGQQRRQR